LHNEINIPDIQYYSNSLPVDKGRLKERCGLEVRTNFFRLRSWQKLGADWIREYTVFVVDQLTFLHFVPHMSFSFSVLYLKFYVHVK
jgi:hypothetical protein